MSKGRKFGIAAGLILAILAVGAGVGLYVKEKYTIHTVYVQGNVHYTEDEIKAIVMEGPLGDNSLYLSFKYKDRGIKGIPFIDVLDVEVLSPDSIKIVVYEKALTGYVSFLDSFMYFDKDGTVVESSSVKTLGVPQITGLNFAYMVVGEKLPVDNPEVFGSIRTITVLLKKYDLTADRISFSRWGSVTVYFGDIQVSLGNDEDRLEDKLMLLPALLPSLAGRSGTLQMETYDEDSGKYIFKPAL